VAFTSVFQVPRLYRGHLAVHSGGFTVLGFHCLVVGFKGRNIYDEIVTPEGDFRVMLSCSACSVFLVFVRGEVKRSNPEKFVSYIEMKSRLREMNPIISIAALHPATLRD
jgi:hypothetical protein